VVERNTFDVIARGEAEPWFQWHFGNGCVESDGMVRLDVVRFADFAQTNEYLREMATGHTHTKAQGTLWQMRLDPKTAKLLEAQEVVDRVCEFPVVQDDCVGQPWRYTYFALHRQEATIGREWFGGIARFDYRTETLTEADLGPNRYVVEPLYAPDAFDGERGWVLTVVYDGESDRSEVWIFASDCLDDEPVCRLGLPDVVPLSFHGIWEPTRKNLS
jgi:carotenoid cleavage dioxygenase-like enzyme